MRLISFISASAFALILAACSSDDSSNGGDGTQTSTSGRTGRIELRLVDAPSDEVTEIVVTITRVEAHVESTGWETLATETRTIDLLKLQGGSFTTLGVGDLPAGRISQFRLYVAEGGPNYVVTPDGAQHPLKVPSGEQSGIKLNAGFDIGPCATGAVTIDFDGKKSIATHPKGAGAGDEWIMRPVVRLKSVTLRGNCEDAGTGDAASGEDGSTPPSTDAGTGNEVSDDGSTGPEPTADAGSTADASTPSPTTDPTISPPPRDECSTVSCGEAAFCFNGTCTEIR